MGQVLKRDKIGAISEAAGDITLQASIVTIGGQQYTTGILSRTIATDVTLVANTRYQIYAVISAGVVVLRVSINENSVGPAGFNGWGLVGSMYASGAATFGAFVTITGIPTSGIFRATGAVSPVFGSLINLQGAPTTNLIDFTPTGSFVTNATYAGKYKQDGDYAIFDYYVATSAGTDAVTLSMNLPTNLVIDTSKLADSSPLTTFILDSNGSIHDSGAVLWGAAHARYQTTTSFDVAYSWNQSTTLVSSDYVTNVAPMTWTTNDEGSLRVRLPIVGWNNTPIEDL